MQINLLLTKEQAEKAGMVVWEGNEGVWYARLPLGKNRNNPLYGYVFTLKN